MESNTTWMQIRKGLINELGADIEKVWFTKAVAKECKETSTLKLTMSTRFMADWMRNNYSQLIQRLASGCGIKRG